ncbi:hypothetical protein WMF11_44420 [Sorangium sp. So ce295]|jgi:hypothetical protein|uniref:hypothetical protein n=1 Tax=Sorangium sp. So ce295 TaxID=3133295 RepID=UPI003F62CEE7
MISTIRSALARCPVRALQLAALALTLATTGCDKVGCFEWTEIEGECPSQDEALAYFGSDLCGGEVESVDSEAEYDGDYCCYDITKRDEYGGTCTSPGGRISPPQPAPPPAPSPPN